MTPISFPVRSNHGPYSIFTAGHRSLLEYPLSMSGCHFIPSSCSLCWCGLTLNCLPFCRTDQYGKETIRAVEREYLSRSISHRSSTPSLSASSSPCSSPVTPPPPLPLARDEEPNVVVVEPEQSGSSMNPNVTLASLEVQICTPLDFGFASSYGASTSALTLDMVPLEAPVAAKGSHPESADENLDDGDALMEDDFSDTSSDWDSDCDEDLDNDLDVDAEGDVDEEVTSPHESLLSFSAMYPTSPTPASSNNEAMLPTYPHSYTQAFFPLPRLSSIPAYPLRGTYPELARLGTPARVLPWHCGSLLMMQRGH